MADSCPSLIVAEYVALCLARGELTDLPALHAPTAAETDILHDLVPEVFARGLRLSDAQAHRIRARAGRKQRGIEKSVVDLNRHCGPLDLDEETLAKARDVLQPVHSLAEALLQTPAEHPFAPFGRDDALVLAAARWFKHDYFRWADPIKCSLCGGETQYRAQGEPSAEDLAGGATRVELHHCGKCGVDRRFPRYNVAKALMNSREGRCGEFAQLFYVFLRVLGVQARYVWNSEDHVWTEYWSPEQKHWVHADSCEAETGKPLLYDRGWGKVQRWCLAFGPHGAEDVTRAYVDDWDACLARRMQATEDGRGVAEQRLKVLLLTTTVQCRARLPAAERSRLAEMDAQQRAWISNEEKRHTEAEKAGLKGKGRESGTREWVEGRGEGGAGARDGSGEDREGTEGRDGKEGEGSKESEDSKEFGDDDYA